MAEVVALAGRLWARARATAPAPPAWLVLAIAAVALATVASRRTWPVARHVVTTAHEGAHGLAAAVSGRRLRGIRLHSDTSGVTVSSGRSRGPGVVLTAAAGYPGQALGGLGAAALLAADRPAAVLWAVLWAVLGALALLVVQIRNWFGLRVVLATAVPALAVTQAAPRWSSRAWRT